MTRYVEIIADSNPPNDVELDDKKYSGQTEHTFAQSEQVQLVDVGNYASSDNPPCMPSGDSRCAILNVYLPLTAQIGTISLWCKEEGGPNWIYSPPGTSPLGWSLFDRVWQETTPTNKVVRAHFKNWSHNRKRWARVLVDFS